MLIHIVLLIYISLMGFVFYKRKPYNRVQNKHFLIWAFVGIFFVQAFRGHNVGWDTPRYVATFYWIRNGTRIRSWEIVFVSLVKGIAKFTDNPQFFIAFSSLIILTGLFIFIYYNIEDTDSAFWPVFFFIVISQYFSTMNLLRQSMAMSIGCNVYTILSKDHSKKAIFASSILVFISSLFHSSGIIQLLLIAPFLTEINYKKILIGIVLSIAVFSLYPFALRLALIVFPRYERYLGGRRDLAASSGIYYVIGGAELLLLVLYCIYIDPRKDNNQNYYKMLIIITFSLAMIMLQRRTSLAIRAGYYFELFLILLFPAFINKLKNIASRGLVKLAVYILGWLYYLYSMNIGARGCVPYSFFWQ